MRITRLRTAAKAVVQAQEEEPFEYVYARMLPSLKRMSYTQSVIGMTADDVLAEMSEVMWKAWASYDPRKGDENLTFEKYWWSCWKNHKWKLVRGVTTHKAKMEQEKTYDTEDVSVFATIAVEGVHPIPPCPLDGDSEAALVWRMTALGYTTAEVKTVLGGDKDRYDRIIDRLRNASLATAA